MKTIFLFPVDHKKAIARLTASLIVFVFMLLMLLINKISWGQTTTTYTILGIFIPPAGVTTVSRVQVWGGGGGGGGNQETTYGSGGGGGGGAYVNYATPITVTPGIIYNVNVGWYGFPFVNSGNGNASSVTFGTTTVTANGGSGGIFQVALVNGSLGVGGAGGLGGTFSGGGGGYGYWAYLNWPYNGYYNYWSGGGGGSAGNASNGNPGSNYTGGAALVDGGAGGGGALCVNTALTSGNGGGGGQPGGGGGGCLSITPADGLKYSGGAGAPGQVIITYTCVTYSLTGTTATSACASTGISMVTLTSSAAGLPVGTYTVTYNTSSPSQTGLTAFMAVTTAGSAIFPATGLTTAVNSTITVTSLGSGSGAAGILCTNAISANNAVTISVSSAAPSQPSAITGNTSICFGSSQNYSVTNTSGVTYTWIFPSGWTQTGGGTSNSVTVTVGTGNGNITVTPSNACGSGTARTLAVSVNMSANPVSASVSLNPICSGASTVLTLNGGGSGPGATIKWYTGSCNSGTLVGTGNNLSVSPTSTVTYYGRYEDGAPCNSNTACAQVMVVVSGCSSTTLTQPAQLVSGAPSANQTLCYGETPSQLSAAAPAGGVGPFSYLWQIYNTGTLGWDDIGGATNLTYSPGALTVTTKYRLKQTDTYCDPDQVVYTNEITITVNALQSISGAFTYYNTANTPLSGSDYTVKLYRSSDNALMGTINPVVSGHYSFTGLCPDRNYYIVATSAHTTAGSVNTTDAAQDNFWGVSPSSIEKVRFYAGDVTGEPPFFINSGDAHLIQAHFVNGTAFDKGNWNFWRVGETISNNTSPTDTYPTVNLPVGSGATADMYGLCAGDFNRSFDPSLSKSASSTLYLIYSGNSEVSGNQEFDLPVHIVKASRVGAVSLILNFPTDMMEIKDVVMNGAGGQLDWAVKGNKLRIGWHSMNPLRFEANAGLLTLKLKSTDTFTKGNSVRLSLASDPLNELADDQYNVIGDAFLSVDVIDAAPVGIEEQTPVNGLTLSNHPNPFNSYTIFEYSLPFNGKVTLEIRNLLGVTEKILVNEIQVSRDYTLKFDAGTLAPGIYTATIILKSESNELVRTIKLVNSR